MLQTIFKWAVLSLGSAWLSLCVWGQQSRPNDLSRQIGALNTELTGAAASQLQNPFTIGMLLDQRAKLLAALMETDPELVLEMGLPQETVTRLRRIAPQAEIESPGEWEGTLESSIADDFEHHRSRTFWHLRTTSRRFEVYFADPTLPRAGGPVRLGGVTIAGRIAAAGIIPAAGEVSAASQQCSTIGPQNVAVLMLTTPQYPALPAGINSTSLRQAFFGSISDTHTTDSLNGYWREMSYGLTSVTGQVFGPFALNQNYTCDQSAQISTAAINAADATVDFTQFTRIALMFPVASCSSYGGLGTIGCRTLSSPTKGSFQASLGWFPESPNSQPSIPLYAHELGHGLGLGHSSSDDYNHVPLGPVNEPGTTDEYGDLFSLMGYPYNGFGIAGQYTAEHKSLILHWLNPGEYQEVQSSGTFTLAPYESSGLRALRILRDPATGAWLWLEYRQPIGDVDKNLQALTGSNVFNGALIHYEDPTLDSLHSYLLDFNPVSTPNDFRSAAMTPGQSWADPHSLLTLTVNSANSSGLSVTVNYAAPCASLQFSSTVFGASGGAGTITVTANAGCAWTAYASSWITLSGQTSGTGNGSVSFSVAPNTGPAQRSGSVSVARQSIGITQTGTNGITVVSVTPNSGSRTSGQFTFRFTDTAGVGDISSVHIYFSQAGTGCEIYAPTSGSYIFVGSMSLLLSTPGASASDGFCTVYSTGSSIAGSGNQLTVTLQVSFSPSFSGWHRLSALASGSIGFSTAVLGTLVVPAPLLGITKVHAGSFTQGQTNATYTVTVSNQAGAAPTSGLVTVTESAPSGLMLLSMAGTGWTCGSTACTRSDALAAGASYPPIAVTVNVASNASSPQVNQVSVSGGGSATANATDSTTIISNQPSLSLSRNTLNFGFNGSRVTSTQTVGVAITKGSGVNWSAVSNQPNITVASASGTGNGTFQVSAAAGSSGIVTVTAPGALNSPQTIQVNVASVTPGLPFGSFDTPLNNTTGVVGAIPVTGWALDLIEVTRVDILREPVIGEPQGNLILIGSAVFVADARPDVAGMFPTYPYQYRAGWGYQMLTNFLPQGNGTFKLHAVAYNKADSRQDLGTKTIVVDNAHAAKPFGTIDTPSQGGTISGTDSVNFGWALTPQPGMIPLDGSTITVVIDGVPLAHPVYNQFRSDIANLFPGYANSMGAVGFYHINTTTLANGVHTISWNVFDNLGRGEGLGSRYFNVLNTGGGGSVAAPEDVIPEAAMPDADGGYSVTMEEVGRLELHLGAAHGMLPIGSTLKGGVFYWQPGPGFLGEYTLHFERLDGSTIPVRVNIVPKRY